MPHDAPAYLNFGGVGPRLTFPRPTQDTSLGKLLSINLVICRDVHLAKKGYRWHAFPCERARQAGRQTSDAPTGIE